MTGWFQPAVLPAAADPSQQVTVIVELDGAPVGVTGGSAADLARQQAPIKNAIAGRGATVLQTYQHALNGFAVRTTRGSVPALAKLPGVRMVKQTRLYQPDNAQSVPFIGAPEVWDGVDGFHGEGIKIGIIDTGLDYTHANFGGPGTAAAYAAAHAAETLPADPTLFGPTSTTKVKGGTDLVGDAYDASSDDPAIKTPHPDPNPLDCNGHGSHVAGTAAGFGVTDTGQTYSGPYDATTPTRSFRIGPGVAPKADLYAIRIFGCSGAASSEVIIQALDWSVEHHLDVVNMSLGSPFGSGSDDADAEIHATDNASLAGVMVVASAGNSGPGAYVTARPASAPRALSVAASDSHQNFGGALMSLSTGDSVTALNANGAVLPGGALPIIVLRDAGGNVSLGCNDSDYPPSVAGKVVVTVRGVCARVDRATLAQAHGAAAAVMLNTGTGYPPFEGPIPGVTIPFLGVRGTISTPGSDATLVLAADGGTTTLSAANIANPSFKALASFTSGGPRFSDTFLKPEVTAPGVSITSTAVGTGNDAEVLSGTSMSAPHVTGLSALVQQSHPSWWSVEDQKQAIINTSSPSDVAGYVVRNSGAGLVNAPNAAKTVAVAFGNSDKSSLSFGFDYDTTDLHETGLLLVRNHGPRDITFNLSQEFAQGAPHSVTFETGSLMVPAWGHASVDVTLNVPIATAGTAATNDPNRLSGPGPLRDVAGVVTLTPTNGGNSSITLHVPYYVVPRALSNVREELTSQLSPSHPTTQVRLTNPGGAIAGTADFYTLGQTANDKPLSLNGKPFELRSAGVRSFAGGEITGQVLVFALNSRGRWTNAAPYEFDVLVTLPDGRLFQVFGFDFGAITTGSADGRVGAFVLNLQTGQLAGDFFAVAPLNGNTILLPVLASRLGLLASNPRFDYNAFAFDAFTPTVSVLPGTGHFNAFTPSITFDQGGFVSVAPGGSTSVNATLDVTEAALTPAKGLMIVSLDNTTEHDAQADTEEATMPPPAAAAASGVRSRASSQPQSVRDVARKKTPRLSPDR
jgi:minor extracellular serine protease Vpr